MTTDVPGTDLRPPDPPPATPSSVPPLTVEHVTKTYASRGRGSFNACEDVSFEIAPGAAVSLVGASGSGKSTLAKMITGVERPSAGSIRFGDLNVEALRGKALRTYRSNVQMVFQDPYGALNPLHTAEYAVNRPLQNFLKMPPRPPGRGSPNCSKRWDWRRPASSSASCPTNCPVANGNAW